MTPKPITAEGNRSTRRYWVGSNRRHDRYNRSLVNRVEDLMDPTFFMDWKTLLNENNHGKRGRPFKTPNAFITFLAKLRSTYSVPFRSLEGLARIFARVTGIRSICYTSIFRRIRKIVPKLPDTTGKPLECAILSGSDQEKKDKFSTHRAGTMVQIKVTSQSCVHDDAILPDLVQERSIYDGPIIYLT